MRFALLAGSASIFIALGTFACSSSSPPAATDEAAPATESNQTEEQPATDDTTPSNSGSNGSSSGDSLPKAPDDGGTGTGTSSGGTSSGGTSSGGTPVDGGSAGALCVAGSVQESEPNDDVGSADSIPSQTGSFCGRLSSGTDVDYVSFTLPANAVSFGMGQNTTSGAIKIEPTADGEAFSFSGGNYPFKPGKVYVLKISTTGGAALDYRISVTIK